MCFLWGDNASDIGVTISAFLAGDVLLLVTVLPMAQYDLTLTFQAAFVLLLGTKGVCWIPF